MLPPAPPRAYSVWFIIERPFTALFLKQGKLKAKINDRQKSLNCIHFSLKAKDIVFIGLRDVLPCEIEFFLKYKIPCFTMREVDVLGIREVKIYR